MEKKRHVEIMLTVNSPKLYDNYTKTQIGDTMHSSMQRCDII